MLSSTSSIFPNVYFFGYEGSKHNRTIYGDTETLAVYVLSALCFILLSHPFTTFNSQPA